MFHSNYRPISHRFRGKLRFPSKIANFSHPPRVFYATIEGVTVVIGYWRRSQEKTSVMGLPDGQKKIGLTI